MLMLVFRLGDNRYAIATQAIMTVLPQVNLQTIPGSPPAVAGVFSYQGQAVPVLDLNQLLRGVASSALLSTRIVLANLGAPGEPVRLLGLLAEQATEMMESNQVEEIAERVDFCQSPYLGGMLQQQQHIIQQLQIYTLLSQQEHEALVAQAATASLA